MRNMLKALGAITLIGAGVTGLAAVAYLQANPLALTTPPVSEAVSPEVPGTVAWPTHASFLLATTPVRQVPDELSQAVTRRATQPNQPLAAAAERGPRPLVACSGWIDMGPASLTGEDGPQRRQVRMLCPEGAPVSDYYEQEL
jgi:hypothetical protein